MFTQRCVWALWALWAAWGLRPGAARGEERVATLQIENRAGLAQSDVQYLSDLVQQAALRLPTDRFSVMTNENMEVMLPPGTRLADCVDECAVQTARNLQAHWLVTGIVSSFGGELKVVLKLYEARSGQPRGAESVGARELRALEGPLQGAALRLFGQLEPSLLEVAERLSGGFVFKKFQVAALPEVRGGAALEGMSPGAVSGVDFGSVDVEVLERYEVASKADQEGSTVSVASRIEQWGRLRGASGEIGEIARRRLRELEAFEAARQESLGRLREISRRDQELERERQAQMKRDWEKLSRLLPLTVLSKEDKLRWLEAFLESYGAVEGLNPYVRESQVVALQGALGAKLERLRADGARELAGRSRRAEEVAARLCELEPNERGCAEQAAERARREAAERARVAQVEKKKREAAERERVAQVEKKRRAELEPRVSALRKWGWVALGASLVSLGVGVYGAVGTQTALDGYPSTWGNHARYVELSSDFTSAKWMAYGGFVGGGLLAAGSIVLFVQASSVAEGARVSASVAPAPGGALASVSWRW